MLRVQIKSIFWLAADDSMYNRAGITMPIGSMIMKCDYTGSDERVY